MKQISAVIIDDEKNSIDLLEIYLEKYCPSAIKIVGTAISKKEGIQLIKDHTPELIFLDILLNDGNGFELLAEVSNLELNIKVIFISAYDRFAIKALRSNAIDYLLKPIQIDELVHAVHKVTNDIDKDIYTDSKQMVTLLTKLPSFNINLDFITISSQKKINFVKVDDIMYSESDGSYTTFFLINGSKIVSSKNLGEYENILSKKLFYRIHHSYLINLKHVIDISREGTNYAKMTSGKILPIAKRRMSDLNKLLKLKF